MLGRYIDWGNPLADHPLNNSIVEGWLPGGPTFGAEKLFGLKRVSDGTLTNSPSWGGGVGGFGSLTFTAGGSEYVNFGTGSVFDQTDAVTLELCVTFTASQSDRFHFGRGFNGAQRYGLLNIGETSQNIGFGFYDGSWHVASDATALSSRVGSRLHVVGTYDRANLRVYVNGVQAGSTAETAAMPSGGTNYLGIGNVVGWITSQGMVVEAAAHFGSALPATTVAGRYEHWLRTGTPHPLRRYSRKVISFGSATGGGGTFTGSGAVTVGAATASGSATFTKPTYSGSGAATVGATTASGAGTFTKPTYSGTGAATVGAATAAGAGTFTKPTYSGAGAVTIGAATAAGTGVFANAVYTGAGAATVGAATTSGSGTFTKPTYSGVGAATVGPATTAGAGTFTGTTYTGSGAVTVGRATAAGVGTFTKPTYSGVGAATTGGTTASGSGIFNTDFFTGVGSVTVGPATASGVGGFTPPPDAPFVLTYYRLKNYFPMPGGSPKASRGRR